jgi:hypothetical protein
MILYTKCLCLQALQLPPAPLLLLLLLCCWRSIALQWQPYQACMRRASAACGLLCAFMCLHAVLCHVYLWRHIHLFLHAAGFAEGAHAGFEFGLVRAALQTLVALHSSSPEIKAQVCGASSACIMQAV